MIDIKSELQIIQKTLIQFLRSPFKEIKTIPDWDWQKIIITQVLLTAITGALGGLFNLSVGSVLFGLILMPILTFITLSIMTLFFFYAFQIFLQKEIPYRQLFIAVFFSNVLFFIFQIISGIFPPASLIGLCATAILLSIVFVEKFLIPKKIVVRMIAGLYALFFVIWVWGHLDATKTERNWKTEAPEVKLGQ